MYLKRISIIFIIIFLLISCSEKANKADTINQFKRIEQESILARQTSQDYVDFLNELEKLQIEFINNPTEELKLKIKQLEEYGLKRFPDLIKTGTDLEGETKKN